MEAVWRIDLLGGLRAVRSEATVTRFRTRKAAALLAYLAFHRDRAHPRELLIELLWPEGLPENGRRSLRVELASLRHQLEPPGIPPFSIIQANRTSVQANPAAINTDVAQFEANLRAAAAGRGLSPRDRIRQLSAAVQPYGGELLPGYFEEWILPERERLAGLFRQALRDLVALLEEHGDLAQALQYARRAAAADQICENSQYELMRLLAVAGQPEEALRHYDRLKPLLERELGDPPGPELEALAAKIRSDRRTPKECRGELPGDSSRSRPAPGDVVLPQAGREPVEPEVAHAYDPAGTEQPVPQAGSAGQGLEILTAAPRGRCEGHLPPRLSRFFGREPEIRELTDLLLQPATRLVTLMGPGGSGKTRLALELAGHLREAFHGAVWWTPLVDLTDSRLIADKLLAALQLHGAPVVEPLEQIAAFLAQQPSLLVLDNYEQLIPEGASLLQTLLERAGLLTCLVTSRQRLELEGERVFPVAPLPIPGVQVFRRSGVQERTADDLNTRTPEHLTILAACPSVQLFLDRAQAVRPDFQITPANAAAVVELCRRLEGLPLALELAAARAGVLTPRQMLARLEQRFDLLARRGRAADARHQSLKAALDWSYQLLAPELQRFFAGLSVFRGGWTLEAAEAVCDEPRACGFLLELEANSLVQADESSGKMRYRLLETIREYGHARLEEAGDLAAASERHARFFFAFVEQVHGIVEPLAPEQDNVRAALEWAVQCAEADLALLTISRLGWFWNRSGDLAEGRRWLAEILALPRGMAPTAARAVGLIRAGELAQSQGDYRAARAYLEESLGIWRARAAGGPLAEEDPKVWEVLHSRLAVTDQWGIGETLRILGHVSLDEGAYERAQALLEEALEIFRQSQRGCEISDTIMTLAGAARGSRDYRRAAALYEESIARYRALGRSGWLVAVPSRDLGHTAFFLGDYGRAAALLKESLTVFWDQGLRLFIPSCLHGIAGVAAETGQPERGARLLGAAETLLEDIGAVPSDEERHEYQRYLAAVRGRLDEIVFAAAWTDGREMSCGSAVEYALQE